MSGSAPTTSLFGVRPSHCPECDYAFDGLPAVGRCPECGRAYDARCVVLRGYGAGRDAGYATGTRKRMWWSLCGWSFFLLFQLWQLASAARRHNVGDWLLTALVLGMMLFEIVKLMWRRSSLDGPPCQLWLCEEGFWLRDRTKSTTPAKAMRVHWIVGWIVAVTIFGVIISIAPKAALAVIALAGVPIALIWRFAQVESPPTTKRLIGETDTVIFQGWEPTMHVRVEDESRGMYRITITPKTGPFWKLDMRRPQAFVTELSASGAVELRTRLDQWIRAAGTPPEMAVPNIAVQSSSATH